MNWASMQRRTLSVLLLGFLLFNVHTVFGIVITRLRTSHNTQRTRLVFDFSGRVPKFNLSQLSNPQRVVIDIPHTTFAVRPPRRILKNTLVDDVRIGKANNKLRIVLDLTDEASAKAFVLRPQYPYGNRLVVDLTHQTPPKTLAKPQSISAPKTLTKKPQIIPSVALPKDMIGRKIIVVIDPGHGGKDPGATGPGGIHEKNVVLSIGRDLSARINRMPGFKAVLTRNGDYYIPLRGRLRIARRDHADMFVSVHADAFINSRSRGASVFALSARGASSEAARWLAEKENYSELGSVDLADKGDVLRSVLLDLSQTATINASLKIGTNVLHQLDHITRLHHSRVEQARFVVLKSPDIPSILVETGFISNPYEERRLNTRSYQKKIANAIANGIVKYFRRHAPPGTYLAIRNRNRSFRHRVKRGESLSIIAQRYDTSVYRLKRMNGLKNNVLYIGQSLVIPTSNG